MDGTRGGRGREGQGRRHPTPGHRPTRRGLRPWGCRLRTRRPAAPRRPSRRTPPPAAGPRSRSGRSGSRRTRPLGGWPGRSWGHCGEKGHVLSSDPEPRRRARCYRMSGPPEGAGGPELMALPHPHCPDTAPRAARGLGRVTATRWRPRRGQDAGKHSARLPDRFPGPWRPPSRSPPQPTGSGGGGGSSPVGNCKPIRGRDTSELPLRVSARTARAVCGLSPLPCSWHSGARQPRAGPSSRC